MSVTRAPRTGSHHGAVIVIVEIIETASSVARTSSNGSIVPQTCPGRKRTRPDRTTSRGSLRACSGRITRLAGFLGSAMQEHGPLSRPPSVRHMKNPTRQWVGLVWNLVGEQNDCRSGRMPRVAHSVSGGCFQCLAAQLARPKPLALSYSALRGGRVPINLQYPEKEVACWNLSRDHQHRPGSFLFVSSGARCLGVPGDNIVPRPERRATGRMSRRCVTEFPVRWPHRSRRRTPGRAYPAP